MGKLKIFSLVCILYASDGIFVDNTSATTSHIELNEQPTEPAHDNPLYAFLDPERSMTFSKMLEILRSEAGKKNSKTGPSEIFYRELPEYPGPKLADLIEVASYDREKCTAAHFRRLVAWRQHLSQRAPLASYLRIIIRDQRRFCDEFLNEATSAAVTSFDESTRVHFELFLGRDRVGHDFYVGPDNAITKLRSLVDKQKLAQLESAQPIAQSGQSFLKACQKITTKLGPLVPIRKNHEIFARLPMRHENYFRVYSFCHHLVDFDFSSELQKILFLDVHSRSSISEFGKYLAKENIPEGRAATSDDNEKQISRAAMNYAANLVKKSQINRKEGLEEALNNLRRSCFSSLDLVENLLWLRKHNLEGLRSDQLDKRAHHYLKALSACNKLVRLDLPKILEHGQEDRTTMDRKKDNSNPILNIFLRLMIKP